MALTKIPGFALDRTSNVTFANANVIGNLTSGNANLGNLATANFFSGNGSLLTNISTSILSNGNSNVNIPSANGNVNISAAGNANIAIITGTGVNVTGYLTATGNVDANNITANILVSTIATGTAPLTVTSNTKVTNLNADLLDGYDTATANTANTVAVRTSTGNLSANFFVGNGYYLTGIDQLAANSADVANYIANGTSNVNTPVANGNITVSVAGVSNTVVFTSTGVNVSGYLNATGDLNASNLSLSGNVTSVLNVTGNANVGNLNTAGSVSANNLTLTGNLVVNGTTTTINSTTTYLDDPLLELGGNTNGAALQVNDGKDRGLYLHRYEGVAGSGGKLVDSFIGWDDSNAEFSFGSNVYVTNDVVTFNNLGNVRANYFFGNGSQLTGLSATTAISLINGSSNVVVTNDGNITAGVGGNASIMTLTPTGANFGGYITTTGNISAGNSVSATYFVGSGQYITGLGSLSNGTSNISIPTSSGNIIFSPGGSFAILQVTQTGTNAAGYLTVSGNLLANTITSNGFANIQGSLTAANANLGNLATANYFNGTLTTLSNSQANIDTIGTLRYLNVSNSTGGNGNIVSINANLGNLARANFFQGDGGLLTNIGAPNLVFLGTSNINIPSANGNITVTVGGNANRVVFTGTGVNVAGYANITGNTTTGNLTVTSNITAENANLGNLISANFISVTSNITAGNLIGSHANGNSNVNIPSINGNVNISASGNANIVVVTGTGANITGTANVTGNLTAGNASLGNLANASYLQGTLITQNQPNITGLGTLLNIVVTANANIGGNVFIGNSTSNVLIANTGVIIATGNLTAANANLGNVVTANYTNAVLTTAAQPNITSIGILGNLTVTNNVSANVLTTGSGSNGNLTIDPDGSGNLVISGTTPVVMSNSLTSNGNVAFSGADISLGAVGNISITGGSTNQFLKTDGSGNLSWATPAGGGGGGTSLTYTADVTPPGAANIADQWYNTTTNTLYEYINDGTTNYWVDIQTPTVSSASTGSALLVQDEGTALTYTANTINFIGAGITATNTGNVVTVSVVATETISPFLLMGA
jgi:hypothetical protein